MLSFSSTVLGGPESTPGNAWTYTYATQGSNSVSTPATYSQSVGAPTTEQGQPATPLDTTITGSNASSTSIAYYGQTAQGFVEYESNMQIYHSGAFFQSTSSTYASPLVGIPATLTAGVPVTVTDTQYDTYTTANGTITQDTDALTYVDTLVSDTLQSITVPAGTYDCYQVSQAETDVTTQIGVDAAPGTSNATVVFYVAQGVGLVESSETLPSADGSGDRTVLQELSTFTGGDRLVFAPTQPSNTQAGDPIKPAITVTLEDATGNTITDDDGDLVTLAPAGVNAANPITGNTATLVDGVATFSDVVLTKAGVYQLNATDANGDTMGQSAKFGVGGDTLTFAVQPKDTDPGQPLTVKVSALTAKGKLDTTLDDTVQLGLTAVSGGSGATLAGTTQLVFKDGSASFTPAAKLSVGVPGTYTLSATALSDGSTDYTVSGATSDSFTVAGYHLAFTTPPGTVDVFDPVPLKVSLVTAHGKVDKDENAAQVQLTLNTKSGGAGAVMQGTTTVTFTAGVAVFPKTAAPTINGGGTFTLTATEIGTDSPAPAELSKPFVVRPLELRPAPIASVNKHFLALRGFQIVESSPPYYLEVFTPEGKMLTQGEVSPSKLPNLQYTVVPVSPGAAVDQTADQMTGGLYESAPGNNLSANPEEYSTYGNFLPFAVPGTYRVQFDPTTPTYAGLNSAAAPSAIKAYTTPLLKVVDPVILAKTSARVVAAGDTLTVAASLVIPNDNDDPVKPQISTGFEFELEGAGSSQTYVQADNYYGDAPTGNAMLDFAIQKPGKYQLVISVVYTPGTQSGVDNVTPFSASNYVLADGLASITVPINVIS